MIDLIIMAHRPDLKPSSLKVYLSALRILNDKKQIVNINFLKNYDDIINKINSKSSNTKKSYLNAIIVALQSLKEDKNLITKYEKLRDDYQNEYSEIMSSHKKTSKQEHNWVEWTDYVKMVDKLSNNVKHLKKKSEWSIDDLNKYQEHLLTLLYKYYPVRNDFHDMKILSKREYNKLKNKKNNYLVLGSPMKFMLHEYKTVDRYGAKELVVNKEVTNAIKLYLKKRDNPEYLLMKPFKLVEPMGTNDLTRSLQRISQREFNGKLIGSSLIRHMYLSHKYGTDVQNKADDSYVMGHSLSMQDGYIKT